MGLTLAFRRTPFNHNSFASLVGALLRSGFAEMGEILLVDDPARIPERTRVVAFSFATPELEDVTSEVNRLRAGRGSRLVLIAGGPHPSADPRGTLQAGFDVVFVGEGEQTLPAWTRQIVDGQSVASPVLTAAARGVDLDEHLHVVSELGLYPFAEISRGCPHGCAFCQTSPLFHRRMRHRSPEVVAAGVRLAMRAGYRRVRYLSPDAFAYRGGQAAGRVEALASLLEAVHQAGAGQQMLGNFPSEVRPEHVETRLLQLVQQHCVNRTIVLGAQSASDRVLRLMRRGHSVEQVREAVRRIAEFGFVPHVDILLGFPGEQPRERRQTLELARWCIQETGARIHAHAYLPLPGTPAWPDPPEALEPDVIAGLRKLESAGHLDGDWEQQQLDGARILRWRDEGRILV